VKFFLLVILSTSVFVCDAQRKILQGQTLDELSLAIPNVHVRNLTSRKITVSDGSGNFDLPAQAGDTLLLTSIGFSPLKVIVAEDWFAERVILILEETYIQLDEVMVNSIPTYELFRDRILEYQPKDSVEFWYFGVKKPVFRGDPMLEGNKYKSPLFAIFHPLSFAHYNLSSKEKEKREYHKITESQPVRDRVNKKFTREFVKTETGLEGTELTSFIAFCDFDMYYLDRTSLFYIKQEMMAKLEEFRGEGKG